MQTSRFRVLRGTAVALAALCASVLTGAQPSAPAPFDLEEATIAGLQQRMQSGQDTSRSLVDKYLARIEALDRSGPALHSRQDQPERMSELPVHALDQRLERARRADEESVRARSQPVGFELRLRRGDRGEPGLRGSRYGDRRLDRLAVE